MHLTALSAILAILLFPSGKIAPEAVTECNCATENPTFPDTPKQENENTPRISFDTMEHDFGIVEFKSKPQTASFEFENTGSAPLVITRTETSCTCLSVNYPRRPVMPGDKGSVEVTYSPKKDIGIFNNNVKIYSNDPVGRPEVLFVRGEVTR